MKSLTNSRVRLTCVSLTILLFAAAAASYGQTSSGQPTGASGGRLRIDQLDRLADKAAESINVSIDERLLKLVAPVLSDTDADEKVAKGIISGLKGIYVRVYEFDAPGAYTDADVSSIREQLRAPGWSKIVQIRSRREGDLDVHVMTGAGGRIDALAVIGFEPKELTIINIVGDIDIEKLSRLEGSFGIPELGIGDGKTRRRKKR